MHQLKRTVFLMVPAFVIISFLATPSFADHEVWEKDDYQEWKRDKREADKERWKAEEKARRGWEKDRRKAEKKWRKAKRKHRRDWEREYHRDWRDEVRYSHGHHHPRKHHVKKHREHYPDHDHGRRSGSHDGGHYPDRDHKRSSGGHDKPKVEGGVDLGIGIYIPFP
jgi:hypothetical protein